MDSTSQTASRFGIGMNYNFTDRFTGAVEGGMVQDLYIKALSTDLLRLDPIMTSIVGGKLRYEVFHDRPFRSGVELGTSYSMPSAGDSYTVSAAYGYCSRIYAQQAVSENLQMNGGLLYLMRNQSSSIATQATTEIGIELGIRWYLGQ